MQGQPTQFAMQRSQTLFDVRSGSRHNGGRGSVLRRELATKISSHRASRSGSRDGDLIRSGTGGGDLGDFRSDSTSLAVSKFQDQTSRFLNLFSYDTARLFVQLCKQWLSHIQFKALVWEKNSTFGGTLTEDGSPPAKGVDGIFYISSSVNALTAERLRGKGVVVLWTPEQQKEQQEELEKEHPHLASDESEALIEALAAFHKLVGRCSTAAHVAEVSDRCFAFWRAEQKRRGIEDTNGRRNSSMKPGILGLFSGSSGSGGARSRTPSQSTSASHNVRRVKSEMTIPENDSQPATPSSTTSNSQISPSSSTGPFSRLFRRAVTISPTASGTPELGVSGPSSPPSLSRSPGEELPRRPGSEDTFDSAADLCAESTRDILRELSSRLPEQLELLEDSSLDRVRKAAATLQEALQDFTEAERLAVLLQVSAVGLASTLPRAVHL